MHDLTVSPREASARTSSRFGNAVRIPAFFLFAFVATAVSALVINTVDAATFQGPTAAPPGSNIPVTVWNRAATAAQQVGAGIDIDGNAGGGNYGINVGSAALSLPVGKNLFYGNASNASLGSLLLLSASGADRFRVNIAGDVIAAGSASFNGSSTSFGGPATNLGNTAGGQNLLYAVTPYANTHSADMLVKLQTNVASVYTDRFTVDRDGNVVVSGTITAATIAATGPLKTDPASCVGRTFVGVTVASYDGNLDQTANSSPATNGYLKADDICEAAFAGAKVCRTDEILESITCSKAGDPIVTNGGQSAWVTGGPPGHTSQTNDCVGWQTDNPTSAPFPSFGRVWAFNDTNGGSGTMTTCNAQLKFACCK